MMLRKGIIPKMIIVVAVLALLSGCTTVIPESEDRIDRPSNMAIPVSGTWRLKDCLQTEANGEASIVSDPLVGKTISLSADAMEYLGDYFDNVSYKIKRVNVNEYFLHKSTIIPEKLSISDNEAFVITVYSGDNFLLEFIRGGNDKLIAAIDDRYYCMEMISDEIPVAQNVTEDTIQQEEYQQDKEPEQTLRSGLLLGVRTPVKTADGLWDYKYGTYWISATDRSHGSLYYTDDIYLPRMDGFWKVKMEKQLGRDGTVDNLVAVKVSGTERETVLRGDFEISAFSNTTERIETKLRRAIVYIGNDYVCVENTVYENSENENKENDKPGDHAAIEAEKTLRTLPIDNLAHLDGITISDLVGENGSMAMESGISELLKNSGQNMLVNIDEKSQEKSFALYRKTGHWFFKGRFNVDQQGQLPYMDFNLNLIPPSNMVAYDILQIPWTQMKDKLPHAIDIYTSPNQDIAIVLTVDEILIYAIENKKLADEPLAVYPLEEGSSVIMAEWSMADYVPSWEKSFLKNNETIKIEAADKE